MKQIHFGNARRIFGKYSNIAIALSFAVSGAMPIILEGRAGAAQLAERKVTIASSQASATNIGYAFNFTITTSVAIQSVRFEFCEMPLGACTLPDGMDINTNASLSATQTFSEGTAFTQYTGVDAGTCDDHNTGAASTEFCISRTDTDAETSGSVNGKALTINGITNPSIDTITPTNSTSLYVRIFVYSDTGFSTLQHEGTVAAAIVNQLTTTGRVQERLVFCVFAQHDDDDLPTDCADTEALESTSVDIGVVDNLSVVRAPINDAPPTSLGNDRYGAAMINTNASNGATISYYASAAGSGSNELRAFRVPGATCDVSGSSTVDQCFVSANDATGETFVAGTERFGLQVACVNTSQGTTNNLGKVGGVFVFNDGTGGSVNTVYDAGNDNTTFSDSGGDCENIAAPTMPYKFGWRDSGTAQAIISSVSVIDDEIIKVRYGATASATTPTGTYTASSTYIATPAF